MSAIPHKKTISIVSILAVAVAIGIWNYTKGDDAIVASPEFASPAAIKQYLLKTIGYGMRDKVFCDYNVLGNKTVHGDTYVDLYLTASCASFTLKNGVVEPTTGSSAHMVLILTKENGIYSILAHRMPQDGSSFGPDIKKLFPSAVQKAIFSQTDREHIWERLRTAAEAFFGAKINE